MAKGVIGEPFTFTVLFLGDDGEPFNPVPDPTIEVFYFDSGGAKQNIVNAGTSMAAVGGDAGRWAYTVTIPADLTPSDQVYGVMLGTDPVSGLDITTEQEVDPFDQGSGQVEILDEGVSLGLFSVVNFVGGDVVVLTVDGVPTIYIPPLPPASYSSHWGTSDGDTGNQSVSESISRSSTHISTPSGGEGTPFNAGDWVDSNQSTSRQTTATFTTSSTITGFGGDASATVEVFDADGGTTLDTFTTPALGANATHTSVSTSISVTISSYGVDDTNYPARQSAAMSVSVVIGTILDGAGLDGGRYHVEITMIPDSTTDGTGPYTYTQDDVFLDTNTTTPSISGDLTVAETAGQTVTKNLSGVSYYDLGSQFTVGVLGIDQLNQNTSRTSQNLRVTGTEYGLPTLNVAASSLTGWSSEENVSGVTYAKTDWAINDNSYRLFSTTGNISAFPRDTWASGGTVTSGNEKILIDTFTTSSGNLADYFDDEDRRQDGAYNGGNTDGNWDSTQALQAGEAMVHNGQLVPPDQAAESDWTTFNPAGPNYSALGVPVSYYRSFVDTVGSNRSSMTISFAGTFVSNAATDLENEDLRIFLRRVASANGGDTGPDANPLRVHGGLYNFAVFDDGVTEAGSYIREASSGGNTVNTTFGGFTCEDGVFVEIEIINQAIKINSIVVAFV
jgi:hypothetical protein